MPRDSTVQTQKHLDLIVLHKPVGVGESAAVLVPCQQVPNVWTCQHHSFEARCIRANVRRAISVTSFFALFCIQAALEEAPRSVPGALSASRRSSTPTR
jgi:hypothetical protein